MQKIDQHNGQVCKVWENGTVPYRWKQKCLMVGGIIMKMRCCMKKKCHFKLPTYTIYCAWLYIWNKIKSLFRSICSLCTSLHCICSGLLRWAIWYGKMWIPLNTMGKFKTWVCLVLYENGYSHIAGSFLKLLSCNGVCALFALAFSTFSAHLCYLNILFASLTLGLTCMHTHNFNFCAHSHNWHTGKWEFETG